VSDDIPDSPDKAGPSPAPEPGRGDESPKQPEDTAPESAEEDQEKLRNAAVSAQAAARLTGEAIEGLFGAAAGRVGVDYSGAGDFVLGPKAEIHVGFGKPDLDWPQVAASELELNFRAFIPPARFADYQARLGENRVLVLRAAKGCGGPATALHLLGVVGERCPVFAMPEDADLQRLQPGPDQAFGYLLRRVPAARIAKLSQVDIERLQEKLAGRGWLVMITDSEARLPDGVSTRWVDDLDERPDPGLVFAGHLHHWLGPTRRAEAKGLIDRQELRELLAETADSPNAVSLAAELAKIVGEEVFAPAGLVMNTVRRRFAQLQGESFDQWYSGVSELSVRCLVVALAVLHGAKPETSLPFTVVAEAADLLERRLLPPLPEAMAVRRAAVRLQERRSMLLAQARAQLVQDTATTYGPAPTEVARFTDELWPKWILERTWREQPGMRDGLLAWLKDLVAHDSEAVQTYAATKVGFLAHFSFDHILRDVIEPWSESGDHRERQAAVTALRVAAAKPSVEPAVWDLAARWSTSGDQEHRHTAIHLYCTVLALRSPERALPQLDQFAGDRFARRSAVYASLASLLVEAGTAVAPAVLDRLLVWAELDDPQWASLTHQQRRFRRENWRRASAFLFVNLASGLSTDRDPDRPEAVAWPALLTVARRDPEVVARLWRAALKDPLYGKAARQILAGWARTVDSDAAARTALADLLDRIAGGDPRTRASIVRQAAVWAGDRAGSAYRSATTVLDRLDAGHGSVDLGQAGASR